MVLRRKHRNRVSQNLNKIWKKLPWNVKKANFLEFKKSLGTLVCLKRYVLRDYQKIHILLLLNSIGWSSITNSQSSKILSLVFEFGTQTPYCHFAKKNRWFFSWEEQIRKGKVKPYTCIINVKERTITKDFWTVNNWREFALSQADVHEKEPYKILLSNFPMISNYRVGLEVRSPLLKFFENIKPKSRWFFSISYLLSVLKKKLITV